MPCFLILGVFGTINVVLGRLIDLPTSALQGLIFWRLGFNFDSSYFTTDFFFFLDRQKEIDR